MILVCAVNLRHKRPCVVESLCIDEHIYKHACALPVPDAVPRGELRRSQGRRQTGIRKEPSTLTSLLYQIQWPALSYAVFKSQFRLIAAVSSTGCPCFGQQLEASRPLLEYVQGNTVQATIHLQLPAGYGV